MPLNRQDTGQCRPLRIIGVEALPVTTHRSILNVQVPVCMQLSVQFCVFEPIDLIVLSYSCDVKGIDIPFLKHNELSVTCIVYRNK